MFYKFHYRDQKCVTPSKVVPIGRVSSNNLLTNTLLSISFMSPTAIVYPVILEDQQPDVVVISLVTDFPLAEYCAAV